MPLVQLKTEGQITLPPELREALRVNDGGYLKAEVVDGAVTLRPLTAADREAAWREIKEAQAAVRYIGPEPRPSPEEEEEWIYEVVREFRARDS